MGDNKDKEVGIFRGIDELWDGDDVFGKLDTGQVLDVLVILVNDFSELSTLNHFFVDPHVNTIKKLEKKVKADNLLFLKKRIRSSVQTGEFRNGRAPVARANNADALTHRSSEITEASEGEHLGCIVVVDVTCSKRE